LQQNDYYFDTHTENVLEWVGKRNKIKGRETS
jgi:hypothetical protein